MSKTKPKSFIYSTTNIFSLLLNGFKNIDTKIMFLAFTVLEIYIFVLNDIILGSSLLYNSDSSQKGTKSELYFIIIDYSMLSYIIVPKAEVCSLKV